MEYQEIVTAYNEKDLDTYSLRDMLKVAKPLKGRQRYRAVSIVDNSLFLNNEITYLLTMSESIEKTKKFLDKLELILNGYFEYLVTTMKNCDATILVEMKPKFYTQTEFEILTKEEKFKILLDINKKYYNFLDYQEVADARDSLGINPRFYNNRILELKFLMEMFNNFKSDTIKEEFFCFSKEFLMTLIDFKKSNKIRIEDFVKNKSKSIQNDYEQYSKYFSTEDFREIIENLTLTSKTLKISLTKTIECFYELSESANEKKHLRGDFIDLHSLEKKYSIMKKLKVKVQKQKIKEEKEKEKRVLEEKVEKERKVQEEQLRKAQEAKEREERDKAIGMQDAYIAEEIKTIVKAKEQVNPMIFTWFESEDVTLTRRVSAKKLNAFFDKIKQIQEQTGVRVSLFLITNSNKELTTKRIEEFKKKATAKGLPNLVEAAFGGYSTFKIDKDGKILDIAQMSEINRTKIVNLLEKPVKYYLSRDQIITGEKNFLRYQFSDNKNSRVTNEQLKTVIDEILKDEKIKRQPLKFLPYKEKDSTGIDVVLESQLKGISQLPDYYKTKYSITPGKTLRADVTTIDQFIEDNKIFMKKA